MEKRKSAPFRGMAGAEINIWSSQKKEWLFKYSINKRDSPFSKKQIYYKSDLLQYLKIKNTVTD